MAVLSILCVVYGLVLTVFSLLSSFYVYHVFDRYVK